MQAVPRHQWIEFLDSLVIEGEVEISHSEIRPLTKGEWKIRSADFDPFDHLIEVVLDNHDVSVRVLLADPSSIAYEGPASDPRKLHIHSPEGDFQMTAHERGEAARS